MPPHPPTPPVTDSQGRRVIPPNPDSETQQTMGTQQVPDETVDRPGPQPLLDEHVYDTTTPKDLRVTHTAMTWEQELKAAEKLEAEKRDLTEHEAARVQMAKDVAAAHADVERAQAREAELQQRQGRA